MGDGSVSGDEPFDAEPGNKELTIVDGRLTIAACDVALTFRSAPRDADLKVGAT